MLIGWLRQPNRKLSNSKLVIILLLLGGWTTLTTIFAVSPSNSYKDWNEFISLIVMVLAATVVMNSRRRLEILVWTIAISIGYYGFKVGIFALRGGGGGSFRGPTYMNGNNELARGAIMLLPLLFFLFRNWKQIWIRSCVGAVAGGTLLTLVLSGSRGAWLGFAAMMAVAALRVRRGLLWVSLALALGAAVVPILPAQIIARFDTIRDYENDPSVQGRFAAWEYALDKFPQRPFMGGGFGIFELEHHKASHNSYMEMLGEHGSIGLLLYLSLLISCFMVPISIVRRTRPIPDLNWACDLAIAIQLAVVGYAVGSISINQAFFPLFHCFVGLLASLQIIVQKELAERGIGVSLKGRKSGKFSIPAWPPPELAPVDAERGVPQ